MQDNIQNEIAKYLQDVSRSICIAQANEKSCDDVRVRLYHQGRREVLEYMHTVLSNLVALIPTREIKYYILKETDNIEDILKGVEQNEYGRNENTGNERSDTQED